MTPATDGQAGTPGCTYGREPKQADQAQVLPLQPTIVMERWPRPAHRPGAQEKTGPETSCSAEPAHERVPAERECQRMSPSWCRIAIPNRKISEAPVAPSRVQ